MGGVDVCDQQIECYRTWVKTKKWTLITFYRFKYSERMDGVP